jgi:hypothetical protein
MCRRTYCQYQWTGFVAMGWLVCSEAARSVSGWEHDDSDRHCRGIASSLLIVGICARLQVSARLAYLLQSLGQHCTFVPMYRRPELPKSLGWDHGGLQWGHAGRPQYEAESFSILSIPPEARARDDCRSSSDEMASISTRAAF